VRALKWLLTKSFVPLATAISVSISTSVLSDAANVT
jgi:hypothetical protein